MEKQEILLFIWSFNFLWKAFIMLTSEHTDMQAQVHIAHTCTGA